MKTTIWLKKKTVSVLQKGIATIEIKNKYPPPQTSNNVDLKQLN